MKEGVSGTPKDRVRAIVEQQPDDSSFDEILSELAFARMIERGVSDADAGRLIPHDDVLRETKSWSK
ncbi:MAG TPA: hypothetical protein VHL58_18185 [Thermoanaerobaculia bacterium]|nr:hypothetical protein [Thermoanaerobaculia bacterium]